MSRFVCVLALGASSLAGCAGADGAGSPDETVEAERAPLGESSCYNHSLTPTNVTEPLVLGGSVSPTAYDHPNCRKAWVVGFEGTVNEKANVDVRWGDMWRRNRAQCVNGKLVISVMSRSGGALPSAFYRIDGEFSAPLIWEDLEGACWYPSLIVFGGASDEDGDGVGDWEIKWKYRKSWGPQNTSHLDFDRTVYSFPGSITGRRARLAVQALTPSGTTQQVFVDYLPFL